MPLVSHTPTAQTDSPEALARVVAMMIVADADLDPTEVHTLDRLEAFDRLGLPRQQFLRVAREYCAELGERMGDQPWLRLSDVQLIDELLAGVKDADKRLLVSRLCAAVITADGRVEDIERMVFDHMLCRWGLTRSDIARAIRSDTLQ